MDKIIITEEVNMETIAPYYDIEGNPMEVFARDWIDLSDEEETVEEVIGGKYLIKEECILLTIVY